MEKILYYTILVSTYTLASYNTVDYGCVVFSLHVHFRLCYFGSTLQPVMCGVMALSCMRCGVLERDLIEITTIARLAYYTPHMQ